MTRVLRTLVVDDEPVARDRLGMLCARIDAVAVIGSVGNGADALATIAAERPDLVLLDVSMPGMDGMTMARMLAEGGGPAVIFCTASERHAVAAFEVRAIDYLLKPIERKRLAAAIERAAEAGPRPAEPWLQEIWVPSRGTMWRLETRLIDRIDAEGDYVRLFSGGRSYLLLETMTRLQHRLDPTLFLRLRRSVIVRRDTIARLTSAGAAWCAVLADGTDIRIGPSFLPAVKEALAR